MKTDDHVQWRNDPNSSWQRGLVAKVFDEHSVIVEPLEGKDRRLVMLCGDIPNRVRPETM